MRFRPLQTFGTLLLSAALGSAQDPIEFTIDGNQPWNWSGTTSLGALEGKPSTSFNVSGTFNLRLENDNVSPMSAGRFTPGSLAVVMPDLAARVPNPVPIFPDLACIDITNLTLEFTSTQFAITGGGAFTTNMTVTALSGIVTVTPLVGAVTQTDLSGTVGAPTLVNGTLSQSGSLITMNSPQAGQFNFTDTGSGISATIDLTGTLLGTHDCPPATNYCQANTNSTGLAGVTGMTGSTRIQDANFNLTASNLPSGQFAYFIASQTQAFVQNPAGSQGNICVGGNIARFNAQVGQVTAGGTFGILVDLDNIPLSPLVAVEPGETWNFQCWYRDANPGATSNFSDGLAVTFCP